ncbi:MAG: hypothetical protein AB2598_01515 [Candidatus Thiodiazotropha sp.]
MKREEDTRYGHFTIYLVCLMLSMPLASLAEQQLTLSESLRDSLLQQGWQEYVAADGSIIYRQPSRESATDNQSAKADPTNMQQFGDALQDRGWQVEWDDEGMLVLRPGEAVSPPVQQPAQPVTTASGTLPADLPGFKYWRIERGEDGALLFHPLKLDPETQSVSTVAMEQPGGCRVDHFQLDTAALPIDQWSEVRELTKKWIDASGESGLLVGKVRKVRRVYLVSVVADTEPYRLMHQLAIRESDGGVILLY